MPATPPTRTSCHSAVLTVLAVLVAAPVAAAETGLATRRPCDFFVGLGGDDDEEGTERDYPKQTLRCALDPNCNNGLETGSVVCVLPGEYEVYDTIRPGCSFEVTVRGIGDDPVIFDGMEQGNIFGAGRTPVNFEGITFTNGKGTTGSAVYAESKVTFADCNFIDNSADVDGAAVMVMRSAEFTRCSFVRNRAKYAAAVRVSDIGAAEFTDCLFRGNVASGKGGAIVTQIEDPNKNYVRIKNTMFCFNEAPEGKHIYNFRATLHECENCSFNGRTCCSDHGRVGANKGDGLPEDAPSQVCKCDDGWAGDECSEPAGVKDEL